MKPVKAKLIAIILPVFINHGFFIPSGSVQQQPNHRCSIPCCDAGDRVRTNEPPPASSAANQPPSGAVASFTLQLPSLSGGLEFLKKKSAIENHQLKRNETAMSIQIPIIISTVLEIHQLKTQIQGIFCFDYPQLMAFEKKFISQGFMVPGLSI
ncbi:hypothetical protein Hdeb2414_s0327g00868951 [Helianthus debilis subsp. tardiflorus]